MTALVALLSQAGNPRAFPFGLVGVTLRTHEGGRSRVAHALVGLGTVVAAATLAACGHGATPEVTASARAAMTAVGSPDAQLSVSQLAFANAKTGWLAVTASFEEQPTTAVEVLHTDDGGKTWDRQWAGPGSAIGLVAFGAQHAWLSIAPTVNCPLHITGARCARTVAPGELLRTDNGGRVWRQVWSGPQQLHEIVFDGPLVGLASLQGPACPVPQEVGTPPLHCPGVVEGTTDGGSHWGPVLRTDGPVLALALQGTTWLAVQNTVALYGTKPKSPPAKLVVWSSIDNGRHWARRASFGPGIVGPYLGVDNVATLVPVGEHRLVLSLVDRDACGHACEETTWVSDDNGRHWSVLSQQLAARFCGPDGLPIWGVAPGLVTYMAANAALNICPPPSAALERLSGDKWLQVHWWQLGTVTAMDWPAARTGYAIIADALAVTTDAGRTWQQAWPPLAPRGPSAVLPGGRAVAAGDSVSPGAVLASSDGGRSWSQLADLPGDISALQFPAGESGFLALAQPSQDRWVVEGSRDGGRHWSVLWALPRAPSLGLGPGTGISGLWMASASDGLLLMTTGTNPGEAVGVAPAELWVTDDAGHHWQRAGVFPAPQYWVLSASAFRRDAGGLWHGLVEGGQGAMVTADTGRTWEKQPQVPQLMAVQYLSGTELVGWQQGVGQRAWLWLSTDGGRRWARRPLPTSGPSAVIGEDELQFAGTGSGWWEAGGRLWSTPDLGLYWRPEAAP